MTRGIIALALISVLTETHKLIYFWNKDQWEMYHLRSDPHETRNLSGDPAQQKVVNGLKVELQRLKTALGDED